MLDWHESPIWSAEVLASAQGHKRCIATGERLAGSAVSQTPRHARFAIGTYCVARRQCKTGSLETCCARQGNVLHTTLPHRSAKLKWRFSPTSVEKSGATGNTQRDSRIGGSEQSRDQRAGHDRLHRTCTAKGGETRQLLTKRRLNDYFGMSLPFATKGGGKAPKLFLAKHSPMQASPPF